MGEQAEFRMSQLRTGHNADNLIFGIMLGFKLGNMLVTCLVSTLETYLVGGTVDGVLVVLETVVVASQEFGSLCFAITTTTSPVLCFIDFFSPKNSIENFLRSRPEFEVEMRKNHEECNDLHVESWCVGRETAARVAMFTELIPPDELE